MPKRKDVKKVVENYFKDNSIKNQKCDIVNYERD